MDIDHGLAGVRSAAGSSVAPHNLDQVQNWSVELTLSNKVPLCGGC